MVTASMETGEARALRDRRRRFAAPGSRHGKLVGFLAKALPLAVGVVAALMVVTPFSPRSEISFLLDRDRVEVIDERLRVDNALYRGQDARGRPFSLAAGEAVQRSSEEGIVWMRDLVARLLLPEGPARLATPAGAYYIDERRVDAAGPVLLVAADGYRMVARGVTVDLGEKMMLGRGGIDGTIPAGTFSADTMSADLAARTITLDGNARVRMVPGALRMPAR
jgi:lipopolysaccharide export system protein LptC